MADKKKKAKQKPRKPKVDLMAGMPRPKPIKFQGATQILEMAHDYPILGCWIMEGWQEQGITPVVVARQQTEDQVAYGVFLVDFYCLGVKDAFWKVEVSLKQFNRNLPQLCSEMPEPCDVSLAHEMIYGAIEYARRYGFEPHPDFKIASLILDPPQTHRGKNKIKFGKDGKPLFVAGPYDNARAIVNQLIQTAGEGNFDYIIVVGKPGNS